MNEGEPEPKQPSADQMDKAFRATRKIPPSWTMGTKLGFVSGAAVPSWVNSIPGPKYHCDADVFKKRSPSWGFSKADERKKELKRCSSAPSPKGPSTDAMEKGWAQTTLQTPKWKIGEKLDMVIGGTVPSWTNSIPGPKYSYDTNLFRERQPVFTIGQKLDMVIGGNIPSWTNSIPGPKYTYDTDKFKNRQPVYTIGEKLATEGEIMSKRSPGPIYEGPVTDATKQSLVDSSKRRTCAPSFGKGSRFEGRAAALVRSGATGRYEHGKFAYG